ncbi:MAG: putative polysaccharide biosynthesis protein [Bacillota bacterium]
MEERQNNNFIKGAAILSVAGLTSKVIGLVYRIILPRLIGAEGIGLYEMAYPIYTTLLVVSRSGIPVSLAKLISDRLVRDMKKSAFKIFRVGRAMSIVAGLFFSIMMMVLAHPISKMLNEKAFYPIIAIAPAIFFVSLLANYRGFFQGFQTMVPTAVSQVIEQIVRMLTMIFLVLFLVKRGYSSGITAAGATFGAVTGSIAGLLVLLYIYHKKQSKLWNSIERDKIENIEYFDIGRNIVNLALPITLGALVLPAMKLVDALIVPNRLQVAGFSENVATELFGHLSGMAIVLVNFPTIITISLAASLVPAISEAFAINRDDLIARKTQTALRLTILVGLPSSVGLFLLAKPLTTVFFGAPAAAVPLRIVSWSVIFITLQQTLSAILQGIGKTQLPARNLFIGSIGNGILNYTLTAIPILGIRGAAIGTATGFAIAAILNLMSVKKYTNFNFKFKTLIYKPIIAATIMGIFVKLSFSYFINFYRLFNKGFAYTLGTLTTVFIAAIIYFITLIVIDEIKYSDLVLIPIFGKKIARFLSKLGLVGDK